jgi:hypothetical protein
MSIYTYTLESGKKWNGRKKSSNSLIIGLKGIISMGLVENSLLGALKVYFVSSNQLYIKQQDHFS